MRVFTALLVLLSLIGMQACATAPHHHYEGPGALSHDSLLHHHAEHPAMAPDCEITKDHHHHYWHCHDDEVKTKPSVSNRLAADDGVALSPTPHIPAPLAFRVVTRTAHPFIPFQTGPPRHSSGLSPPVPAPIR